jgi:hypothetical protein
MANRKTMKANRAGHLAPIEAKNARLRRVAAERAADVGEVQTMRSARRSDGAVDPALRLLVGVPPRD